MAGIRTLEMGFPKEVKTYTNEAKVIAKVKEYTDRIQGMCNVRIVPVVTEPKVTDPDGWQRVRYTAMLFCFSEESDIFVLARAGCPFLMHR